MPLVAHVPRPALIRTRYPSLKNSFRKCWERHARWSASLRPTFRTQVLSNTAEDASRFLIPHV